MCFTIIHLKTHIDLSLIYPHFALQVHLLGLNACFIKYNHYLCGVLL